MPQPEAESYAAFNRETWDAVAERPTTIVN
jgi:hypothetical protein